MTRDLRRKKQALSLEEAKAILASATYGVLAISAGDEPYAVPLNHVYVRGGGADVKSRARAHEDHDSASDFGALYFHCAPEGHKIDVLKANPNASFCVVAQHDVLPDNFATAYKSVIAFGQIAILDGKDAHDELYALGERFNPGAHDAIEREIEKDGPHCLVLKMAISHISGKQARALVKKQWLDTA